MNPIIHQRENNSPDPLRFEFYFQELDTSVLVQTEDDGVVIRATEDSFSERRRERFIHELALEGFIDDRFCNFRVGDAGLRWIIDRSWLRLDEAQMKRTSQIAASLGVGCGLLLLFVFAMSGVYTAMVHTQLTGAQSSSAPVSHTSRWSGH